jgi:hypothetical protein
LNEVEEGERIRKKKNNIAKLKGGLPEMSLYKDNNRNKGSGSFWNRLCGAITLGCGSNR